MLEARVAVAQLELEAGALEANRQRTVQAIETARGEDADLVVLPELAASGYLLADWREARSVSESIPGPTTEAWQEQAKAGSCYIVGGLCEISGGSLYNSVAVVGPDGVLGAYRKLHLFDREQLLFRRGDLGLPVFDLPFGRIGVLVCYDLRFVEAMRVLSALGADLVVVPTAWAPGFDPTPPADGIIDQVRAAMVQANTSQVFVAAASRVGADGDVKFLGSSTIVNPNGRFVYGPASMEEEVIHVEEIDLSEARRSKVRRPLITPGADRRTDVYDDLLGYDPNRFNSLQEQFRS